MWNWFRKKEEPKQEIDLIEQREKEQILKKLDIARKKLKLPNIIDYRFYNKLFEILADYETKLADQEKRIRYLEEKYKEK